MLAYGQVDGRDWNWTARLRLLISAQVSVPGLGLLAGSDRLLCAFPLQNA